MAQVTIRLSMTQAEFTKEVIEAEVAYNKRVATDPDFAAAQAGVLDITAFKRHAAQRAMLGEAVMKELG